MSDAGHLHTMGEGRRAAADGGRFDAWLESELRRALAPAAHARPAPRVGRRALPARLGRRSLSLSGGITAALAAKALPGVAAVALAAGVAGTAVTGSPNPAAWGQRVEEAVESCRAAAQEPGLGPCVSAFAQRHSPPAAASPAPRPDDPESPKSTRGHAAGPASASPAPALQATPAATPRSEPARGARLSPSPRSPGHSPGHGDRERD